jgi:hypothetical protein
MLREEIMQQLRETGRTEFWGVTAAGLVYAWLAAHKDVSPFAWCISPCVILFCGLRVLTITSRMRSIAVYLRRIEEAAFGQETELPGWERYIDGEVGHFAGFSPAVAAIVYWTFVLMLSILASWLLSR